MAESACLPLSKRRLQSLKYSLKTREQQSSGVPVDVKAQHQIIFAERPWRVCRKRAHPGDSRGVQIPVKATAFSSFTPSSSSQSHLSPFPLSARPLHWDFAHTMNLYPLPTSLVLADSEAPAFVVKYFGCTVMNPGSIDESGGRGRREGRARWVEFDIRTSAGVVRMEG